jgi:hypothetical protein
MGLKQLLVEHGRLGVIILIELRLTLPIKKLIGQVSGLREIGREQGRHRRIVLEHEPALGLKENRPRHLGGVRKILQEIPKFVVRPLPEPDLKGPDGGQERPVRFRAFSGMGQRQLGSQQHCQDSGSPGPKP